MASWIRPFQTRPCRHVALFLGIALLGAGRFLPALAGADLELTATIGGRRVVAFAVVDGAIVTPGSGTDQAVPPGTKFELAGDLWSRPELVDFAPEYEIHRPAPVVGEAVDPAVFSVPVLLRHGSPGAWSDPNLEGAIAVFVWLLDGQPVQVAPVAIQLNRGSDELGLAALHAFDVDEVSARGAPAILLLGRNGFIAPAARFASESAQRVLMAMHRGAEDLDPASWPDDPALVTATTTDKRTLLHQAAEAGKAAFVRELLKRGAVATARSDAKLTPLNLAAGHGRSEVVQLLHMALPQRDTDEAVVLAMTRGHLDQGAMLLAGVKRETLNLALGAAVDYGRADVAQACFDQAGPRNSFGTLLPEYGARAIYHGQTAMLEFLLAHGLSPNARPRSFPLVVIAGQSGTPDMIAALCRHRAEVNATGPDRRTALMHAAEREQVEAVTTLLDAGADLNRTDEAKRTALHHAAGAGRSQVVPLLLAQRANPNATDQNQQTPLDQACAGGAHAVIDQLLAAGGRLNSRNRGLRLSLIRACTLDRADVLQAAVADGWKPREPLFEKWTAAMIAEALGSTHVQAWLATVLPTETMAAPPLEAQPDRPFEIASGGRPFDARPRNRPQPAVQAELHGVVDTEGHLRFAVVRRCEDATLAAAILRTAEAWVFTPAHKAGRPVNSRLALAVTFPARVPGIVPPGELESPPAIASTVPVSAATGRDDLVVTRIEVSRRPMSTGGEVTGIRQYNEKVTTYENTAETWAVVRCIVETDGTPTNIAVVRAPLDAFGEQAALALTRFTFLPAQGGGRPVRAWMSVAVRSTD